MKRIALTQGQYALVDDADFDRLNQWKWFAHKTPHSHTFYAIRTVYLGGGRKNAKRRCVRMHREILDLKSGEQCDHKNRNGLDNRRDNLRKSTASQNCANRRATGASQYRGVSWKKRNSKWCAQVSVNGKYKHIGLFNSERAAALAYAQAAKNIYGEFFATH